jgi:predicted alpha/beta hydrolase
VIELLALGDSRPLAAELFEPSGPAKGVALIAPAMAVPQRFYAAFAKDLAQRQQVVALTLDYRGIGKSATVHPRREKATFHEWGTKDLAGAMQWLREKYSELPITLVGHSAGGQLMGMLPELPDRALFIASGSAYFGAYRGKARAFMAAFHWTIVPTVTAVRGFLPMPGSGAVPKGVAREWSEWGRHPRYVRKYADANLLTGYDNFRGPLRAICFEDDSYAPKTAVESLLSLYPNARKELHVLPGPVGHFGFFKQQRSWGDPLLSFVSGATP